MNYDELVDNNKVRFENMLPQAFLLGLLSTFDNRYQAYADRLFKEITWKQFFTIICINLCKESPTINELSDIMGSSHQNVKQILLKLESKDFIRMVTDKIDKRKRRIEVTDKCREFCKKNSEQSDNAILSMFDGIDEQDLIITIQTIMKMEKNIIKQEE